MNPNGEVSPDFYELAKQIDDLGAAVRQLARTRPLVRLETVGNELPYALVSPDANWCLWPHRDGQSTIMRQSEEGEEYDFRVVGTPEEVAAKLGRPIR